MAAPRAISTAGAFKLANLCLNISARSPIPTERNAHHVYVSVPVRYIRQMREVLEAEGIDWVADAKEYQRQLRRARKDSKLLGDQVP